MKKTAVLLLLLVCFTFFHGCKKTEDGSYVAPITISEKLNGTWVLTELIQVDEIAKSNAEADTAKVQQKLTNYLNFPSLTVTFSVDENNLPTSYAIAGTAPALLSPSGYWKLDMSYPHTDNSVSRIFLYSDQAKTIQTATLYITAIPGSLPVLQFSLTRKVNGIPFVSYNYKFSIQNKTK